MRCPTEELAAKVKTHPSVKFCVSSLEAFSVELDLAMCVRDDAKLSTDEVTEVHSYF